GVSFTDNGDGTATLAGTPAAGSGGSYPVTLTVTNSVGSSNQSFTLTVTDGPSITSPDHATFAVGSAESFTVTTNAGTPADVALAIGSGDTLPSGVTFHDNGDGTAALAGTPATSSGGSYSLTITASNSAHLSSTQSFTLTVTELPAISSPDHATFTVGGAGSFTVHTTAGYPAATTLTEAGALPSGVSFTDNGDGTATLAGTATSGGSYPITLSATNSAGHTDQSFTLTVTDAPVITSPDHTTFAVGTAGSFTVHTTAGTPSDVALAIGSGDTLPAGVSFHDNGDGTAALAGTPAAGSGGSYALTITASNSAHLSSTQNFTLTVTELPAVSSPDHTTFTVGTAGSFPITTTAGYPASTTLTETGSLPPGVTFTDNGDGTATLAGTPAAGSGGSYALVLTATNSAGHTDQAFTLTVTDAPAITSPDHASFDAGHAGTFTVTTSGGYPVHPALTETGALPSGVTFHDNGDGTATLAGTPATGGVFPLTFTADNGASTAATQSFTLTVTEPPAITSANHATFYEGINGSFTVTTRPGVPASPITLSETGKLPRGLAFHDRGDGTATLSGKAIGDVKGTYHLTIAASNGTVGTGSQAFTLVVTHAGGVGLPGQQPPSSGTLQGLPQHTQPGQLVTVSGSGFAPGAPITIALYPSRIVLARATAAADGTFTATFRLPTVTGTQTLVAAGIGTDGKVRYLEAGTVTSADSSGGTASNGGGPLADTGPAIDVRRAGGYALAAMFAGLGLVAAGRRRNRVQ
ncbi:MAG TPA: putative Ig domain-containing protein, partial [Jatrophihabitans sp.]|nr:putative Ig domain-containing protein [Jatrophihabitans sp.]